MTGMSSIVYFIKDIESAGRWFENIFNIKSFQTEGNFIGFMINNFEISFHRANKKSTNHVGNQASYWKVSNLENMKETLLKNRCSIY